MERELKKKASLSLVRDINYALVWEFFAEHGRSSIPNIAVNLGLSLPTVTRAVEFGIQAGLVATAEMTASGRGRKAQLYQLNGEYSTFLLMMLENESLYYEVRDIVGGVRETGSLAVGYESVLSGIEDVFAHCMRQYSNLSNAAVAISGVISGGVILDSWTLPYLNGFPLQRYLSDKYDVAVSVENNVKTVTMAAKKYVKDFDEKTIVAFEFGHTGYGAGVLVNGEILHGLSGAACEIGSLPLTADRSDSDRTVLYAQSLEVLISVLNPHAVIVYDAGEGGEADVDRMIAYVKERTAPYAFPWVVRSSEFVEDCIYGLNTLCMQHLNESLKVRGVV